MSILHWLFNKIEPKGRNNWLSVQFARWKYGNLETRNVMFEQNVKGLRFFEAAGAGKISLSESAHHHCGGVVGFQVGVSWSEDGYLGGVLGRSEAKKMAEFILEKCKEIDISEDDERIQFDKKFLAYGKKESI